MLLVGSKTMIQNKCSKMLNLLCYFGSPVEVFSALEVYKECKQISFHFWSENTPNLLRFGTNNAQNQVLTFLAKKQFTNLVVDSLIFEVFRAKREA